MAPLLGMPGEANLAYGSGLTLGLLASAFKHCQA